MGTPGKLGETKKRRRRRRIYISAGGASEASGTCRLSMHHAYTAGSFTAFSHQRLCIFAAFGDAGKSDCCTCPQITPFGALPAPPSFPGEPLYRLRFVRTQQKKVRQTSRFGYGQGKTIVPKGGGHKRHMSLQCLCPPPLGTMACGAPPAFRAERVSRHPDL